jgi:hypothetical protein
MSLTTVPGLSYLFIRARAIGLSRPTGLYWLVSLPYLLYLTTQFAARGYVLTLHLLIDCLDSE